jgi:hypothetical protein
MIALSVWAISLLQRAFARANAASVSATSTTVSANGLIVAGATLYREPLAAGAAIVPLTIGIVLSALGAIALAVRGAGQDDQPSRQAAGPRHADARPEHQRFRRGRSDA